MHGKGIYVNHFTRVPAMQIRFTHECLHFSQQKTFQKPGYGSTALPEDGIPGFLWVQGCSPLSAGSQIRADKAQAGNKAGEYTVVSEHSLSARNTTIGP
jgi:hypothetical protein